MPETTDKVADAVQLRQDFDALLERAKTLGLEDGVPDELRDAADAVRTLDAPRTSRIAKTLELDESAGEAMILGAIEKLRQPATLDALTARAGDLGKVLLDSDEHTKLQSEAAAGRKAQVDLADQTFTLAWDKAMFEGRVDAREDTKTSMRAFYDANQDACIKWLAAAPKLVNVATPAEPVEREHEDGEDDETDAVRLEKAKAYQAEHPNTDLITALEAVS